MSLKRRLIYKMSKPVVTKTIDTLQTMRERLGAEDEAQKVLNARRQAQYDMTYQDWAASSIRIMASYSVLLVIILLTLVLVYMYGNTIRTQANSLM